LIQQATNPMFKTIALLALGAAMYGPITAVGSAALGFAHSTVQDVNAATSRRCEQMNQITPGSCVMP
jgi:sugar phosphate permease